MTQQQVDAYKARLDAVAALKQAKNRADTKSISEAQERLRAATHACLQVEARLGKT